MMSDDSDNVISSDEEVVPTKYTKKSKTTETVSVDEMQNMFESMMKPLIDTVTELNGKIETLQEVNERSKSKKKSKKSKKKANSSSSDDDSSSDDEPKQSRKPQPKNAWIMFIQINKEQITEFLTENEDDEMFENITDGRKRRQTAAKHLYNQLTKEEKADYKQRGIDMFQEECSDD